MRKIGVVIGVAVAVLLVVSVGAYVYSKPPAPQEGRKDIYVFLPSVENPFWLNVREGIQKEAARHRANYDVRIVTTASTDGSDQVDEMSTALARGDAAAIVLGPTNDRAPAPIVAQFNRAEAKVVLIDTPLNAEAANEVGARSDAVIGSDNVLGGQKAAQTILAALAGRNGRQRVLLLKGSYVHQSAIDRAEGFIKGAGNKLEIIEREGEWSRQRANEITSSEFARQPLAAIFASNDDMALGAVAALKQQHVSKDKWPIIVGFDATPDALRAIHDGDMFASIRQQAGKMGADGLSTAIALILGAPSSKGEVLVPVDVVTASTTGLQ